MTHRHNAELSARRKQQQSHVRSLHSFAAAAENADENDKDVDAGRGGNTAKEQLSRMVGILLCEFHFDVFDGHFTVVVCMSHIHGHHLYHIVTLCCSSHLN